MMFIYKVVLCLIIFFIGFIISSFLHFLHFGGIFVIIPLFASIAGVKAVVKYKPKKKIEQNLLDKSILNNDK